MSGMLPLTTAEEPFECRVTSYGGRGLFATKPIPADTLLRTCPAPYAAAIYAPFRKEVCAHCFAYAFDAGRNTWNIKHDASPGSRFCSAACLEDWSRERDLNLLARVEKAIHALAKSSVKRPATPVLPTLDLSGATPAATMQAIDEAWQVAERLPVKDGALVLDEMEEEILRFVLSAFLRRHAEDTADPVQDAAHPVEDATSSAEDTARAVVGASNPAEDTSFSANATSSIIKATSGATANLVVPTQNTNPAGSWAAFLALQDNEAAHVRARLAILATHIRVWLFARLALLSAPERRAHGGAPERREHGGGPEWREASAARGADVGIPELSAYVRTPATLRAVLARDHANAFGIFDAQEAGESEMLGWAVYPAGSYFNHDCAPNVRKQRAGRTLRFLTTRAVAAGAELCISYVDTADGRTARRALCREHWGFECVCKRCQEEGEEEG
ncbi:hypothetical protein HDZ31DRAFT_73245 [Schizophyllum fasciatum]